MTDMNTDNTRDEATPSPASAGSHGPLFSERLRLSKQAEEWCDGNRVPHHPLNIVTALFSRGLVSLKPTLTAEEREAVVAADSELSAIGHNRPPDKAECLRISRTLRSLLERLK